MKYAIISTDIRSELQILLMSRRIRLCKQKIQFEFHVKWRLVSGITKTHFNFPINYCYKTPTLYLITKLSVNSDTTERTKGNISNYAFILYVDKNV